MSDMAKMSTTLELQVTIPGIDELRKQLEEKGAIFHEISDRIEKLEKRMAAIETKTKPATAGEQGRGVAGE